MMRFSARRVVVGAGLLVTAIGLGSTPWTFAEESIKPATMPATAPTTSPATTIPATAPTTSAVSTTAPTTTASATTAPTTSPAGPATVVVKKGDLTLEVRADAVFQPADSFEVKTQFKAYAAPLLITSLVPPGSAIRKDQPLITFDRTYFDWTLAAAENDYAVAKAGLARAEIDAKLAAQSDQLSLRQTEDLLKNAEAGKKWFEDVDGPQLLLLSDMQAKQAQNSVDDQNDELDQLRKMYQGEELTSATADIVVRRAVRSVEIGKVILKVQQERRDKSKNFEYPIIRQRVLDSIEVAKTNLASTKAQQEQTAVARTASLQLAKTSVEQAAKRLADLKEDANYFQFRAPSDGVVVYGNLVDAAWTGGDAKTFKVGEKVAAGQVLMRVYQPGKLRLVLNLPESQAFWVEQGDKARITPATLPQTNYTAQTSAVEIQSKNTQGIAFVTTLDLDNVDSRLLPGMKASVVIEADKIKDALLLPLAVAAGGNVQVKEKDGTIVEKAIKLGKTDGQQVEIKSGLSEGDEIIKK